MAAALRIGIIGGGAWGTALACAARRSGHRVVMWVREPEVIATIRTAGQNTVFLPGVRLDPEIAAVGDIAEAVAADLVFCVVPTAHLRAVIAAAAPRWPATLPAISCAKGLEQPDGRWPSEILAEELPGRPSAILSGPSFAAEVARGLPTAVTCAAAPIDLADRVATALGSRRMRIYTTDDLVGVQVGGAVKNVLAIAAGIVSGRDLGENARAAVITRGLAEMARLVQALGGRRETAMGLSGLGDLVLTATSTQSRNTSLGIALGRGGSVDAVRRAHRSVAEGATTAAAVVALAGRIGVDMPICRAVDAVVSGTAPMDTVIERLLDRPVPRETD